MEEIIWVLKQRWRQLQDFRKDIRTIWDDAAAKELNLHYLEPQSEDSEKMLQFLEQQQQALSEAKTKLEQANEYAIDAFGRSQQVEHFLKLKQQDIRRAYQDNELFQEYRAATLAEFPAIASLIHQANHAC